MPPPYVGGCRRARRRLTRRPACGDPRPARRGLGGPPPLLASPAPYGRAPPRRAGLRESGVRLRRAFLSAAASGGGPGGWVALIAPPASASAGCALLPAVALRPLAAASAASRRLVRLPRPTGRARVRCAAPRRRFRPPPLPHCPFDDVLGLPNQAALRCSCPRATLMIWEPSLRHHLSG